MSRVSGGMFLKKNILPQARNYGQSNKDLPRFPDGRAVLASGRGFHVPSFAVRFSLGGLVLKRG